MSLNTRASTWWAAGGAFTVGGPSEQTNGSPPSPRRIDSLNTSRSRQRSRICSSSAGKSGLAGNGRGKGRMMLVMGRLDELDLNLKLSREEEAEKLDAAQPRLLQLRLVLGGLPGDQGLGPP